MKALFGDVALTPKDLTFNSLQLYGGNSVGRADEERARKEQKAKEEELETPKEKVKARQQELRRKFYNPNLEPSKIAEQIRKGNR